MSIIDKLKNNKKIYRFHYLYFNNYPFIETHDCSCDAFVLPDNMSQSDAFKVISYFFENSKVEIGTYSCCRMTTEVLNSVGFKRIDNIKNDEYNVVDLFSVLSNDGGNLFRESEYYDHYFNWYSSGVTKEDVLDIYSKNDMYISFDKPNILQKKINF